MNKDTKKIIKNIKPKIENKNPSQEDNIKIAKDNFNINKEPYKKGNKKDEKIFLSMVLPLAITLIIEFIGIIIAIIRKYCNLPKLEIVGIIFILIGFFGFFIAIVFVIIYGKIYEKQLKNNKQKIDEEISK